MMLTKAAYYLRDIIMLLLILRAIMSWFSFVIDNNIFRFINKVIYEATEPLLIPMRDLFDKLGLSGSVIDFSFLASWFLIKYVFNILINILYNLRL